MGRPSPASHPPTILGARCGRGRVSGPQQPDAHSRAALPRVVAVYERELPQPNPNPNPNQGQVVAVHERELPQLPAEQGLLRLLQAPGLRVPGGVISNHATARRLLQGCWLFLDELAHEEDGGVRCFFIYPLCIQIAARVRSLAPRETKFGVAVDGRSLREQHGCRTAGRPSGEPQRPAARLASRAQPDRRRPPDPRPRPWLVQCRHHVKPRSGQREHPRPAEPAGSRGRPVPLRQRHQALHRRGGAPPHGGRCALSHRFGCGTRRPASGARQRYECGGTG